MSTEQPDCRRAYSSSWAPVSRIDVDQDRADLGGGELRNHPLGIVRRPDADAIALHHTAGDQPAREAVACVLKLPVCVAEFLMTRDQGLVIRATLSYVI